MENSENKYSFDSQILKALIEQGPSFVMELLRLGMNEAMKVEREQFLNAGAYQRTEARQGHANGFKPKTLFPLWKVTLHVWASSLNNSDSTSSVFISPLIKTRISCGFIIISH